MANGWTEEKRRLGSTRIGRQVQHGDQKRTPKIRQHLDVVRQRPGICLTDGQKGIQLGGRQSHQEFAPASGATK